MLIKGRGLRRSDLFVPIAEFDWKAHTSSLADSGQTKERSARSAIPAEPHAD